MSPTDTIRALLEQVWSRGDTDLIPTLIAPRYTVHRDPGDQWEGQTLDRDTYTQRLLWCRKSLHDLTFSIEALLATPTDAFVRWTYTGTQSGPIPGLGITHRDVEVTGITHYPLLDGQVTGHWQQTDQVGLLRQLGVPVPG